MEYKSVPKPRIGYLSSKLGARVISLVLIFLLGCAQSPTPTPMLTVPSPTTKPSPIRETPTGTLSATATFVPSPTPTVSLSVPAPNPDLTKYGGTLTYAIAGAPPRLDPQLEDSDITRAVVQPAYNGLVRIDPFSSGRRVIPDLGERWEMLDPNNWVFQLRRGVTFHDGTFFTADDVKFSFDRTINAPGIVPSAEARIALSPIKEVRVLNDYALLIRTDRPWASALNTLSAWHMKIVPRQLFQSANLDGYVMGTGPFTLKDYASDKDTILGKNGNYWQKGMPFLDRIQIAQIADPEMRFAAFKSGKLDLLLEEQNVSQVEELIRNNPKVKIWQAQDPEREPDVRLNTTKSLLKDIRVRKAIRLAVDDGRIYATMGNSCPPAFNSPMGLSQWALPQDELARRPENALVVQDARLKEARRLLIEAGLSEGFSIALTVAQPSSFPQAEAYMARARLLQQPLAELGLGVTIARKDYPEQFTQAVLTQDFQVAMGPLGFLPVTDPDFLRLEWASNGSRNYIGYADPELDQVLDSQSQLLDAEQRLKAVQALQRRILDSYVAFYLPIPRSCPDGPGIPAQPWVRGYQPDWQGALHDNLSFREVWIDRSAKAAK